MLADKLELRAPLTTDSEWVPTRSTWWCWGPGSITAEPTSRAVGAG